MKKYLLSIAALLLGLLAHSQEADDLGNYAEVSIIPRLDLNPTWSNSETGFNLGNSSLYTLFEGSASEHFSWTVANHWVSASEWGAIGEETSALYKGLGYSDGNNLIDMMYVDLSFGSWTFNLGKNAIATGGHEYDDWDWLVHPVLASPLWNELACYQWGGKVSWSTPSEMTTFSLQMTTSPFGERPFGSGLWTWSAQWSGDYDWFKPLWSFSAFEQEAGEFGSAPKDYQFLVSLGNQFCFGDWTLTLDWSNTAGLAFDYSRFQKGWLLHGNLVYGLSDRLDLSLIGNYVSPAKTAAQYYDAFVYQTSWWSLGAVAEFYPLRDSRDLRLHAIAAYNDLFDQFELSFGVLYNLNFRLW